MKTLGYEGISTAIFSQLNYLSRDLGKEKSLLQTLKYLRLLAALFYSFHDLIKLVYTTYIFLNVLVLLY